MAEIWFHRPFMAKAYMDMRTIARLYGPFENPGPIIAYPPNQFWFSNHSKDTVYKGDRFAIPWPKGKIVQQIEFEQNQIADKFKHAEKATMAVTKNAQDWKTVALLVDVAAIVATVGYSAGSAGTTYLRSTKKIPEAIAKVGTTAKPPSVASLKNLAKGTNAYLHIGNTQNRKIIAHILKHAERELLVQAGKKAQLSVGIASGYTGGGIAACGTYKAYSAAGSEKAVNKSNSVSRAIKNGDAGKADRAAKKKDNQWWNQISRHALGIVSPSYWTTILYGIGTGDWAPWKKGPEVFTQQNLKLITKNLLETVGACSVKIAALNEQLQMPFYNHRV